MRALFASLLALTVAGCATAPVYKRADDAAINRPTASAAFQNSENAAFAANAVPGEWWKLYTDDRLNGLIKDALTANTDLRAAAARIERARIGLDVAKDDAGIKTEVSAGLEYGQPAAQEYLLLGEHLPSDFLYNARGSPIRSIWPGR